MATIEKPPAIDEAADSPTVSYGPSSPAPEPAGAARQFLPGARLGNRYRIVELLGRGGMGEVYRADDLHLGQAVALKFLPERLTSDPSAMARLRNEVRVARQIAHPNVCRVYDICEEEGVRFLAMEYIDGEDLGSVLRRLGRPSREKGVEIARQLCVGLAAAHEVGVLHRDLKPDNVMIDGRGRVRITDFGLASFVQDLPAAGHAGTPSYMAPELFDAVPASARTDIYALGAVLYELFTGRRAFRATSVEEVRRMHATVTPRSPTRIVGDLEAGIEEIILRCLDKDPDKRPQSALSVAAALPGQDLVAAALAAGQTPSPELIAEAGGRGALSPAGAGALLVAVVAGVLGVAGLNGRVSLPGLAPPAKPTVVLADTARGIFARLGYVDEPVDVARGWAAYPGYLEHVRDTDPAVDRWERLRGRRPPVFWLWYRESPVTMVARNVEHHVSFQDPPLTIPGMRALKLDDRGRLAVLRVVPPQAVDRTRSGGPVDYRWLFEAAGLDPADFRPAEPEWVPPQYADARIAWVGHYPGEPEWPIRVEAASYAGDPVYFNVLESFDRPWTGPDERGRGAVKTGSLVMYVVVLAVALVVPPILARRNLRRGTGDRVGAVRLGVVIWASGLVGWMLWVDHPGEIGPEIETIIVGLGLTVLLGVWSGLVYLGLEPHVRRRLPETLISWTRLLMGRFRDPRVGRDVLVGALGGTIVILVQRTEWLVPAWLGTPTRIPFSSYYAAFDLGPKTWATVVQPEMFFGPLILLLTLTAVLYLVRRRWAAIALTFAVFAILDGPMITEGPALVQISAILELLVVWAVILFTLVRFGLLATVAAFFFFSLLQSWPLILDTSVWFRGSSIAGIAVLIAVAAAAARVSVGRRPVSAV